MRTNLSPAALSLRSAVIPRPQNDADAVTCEVAQEHGRGESDVASSSLSGHNPHSPELQYRSNQPVRGKSPQPLRYSAGAPSLSDLLQSGHVPLVRRRPPLQRLACPSSTPS